MRERQLEGEKWTDARHRRRSLLWRGQGGARQKETSGWPSAKSCVAGCLGWLQELEMSVRCLRQRRSLVYALAIEGA